MKPNFALRLSHDGVEVLHRAPAGWESVGSARFDDANLESSLARLRATAEARGQGTIRSKLIMPASELRYETVLAPGPTDEARRHQIEAEIEGLTPYAVNELAFDWVVEGDHALVVIAARETMAEAETFARDHGFNPVSFVAQPAPGQFAGEPFLGETGMARTLLAPGERVERDIEPVRIAAPTARPTSAAAPASPVPRKAPPAPPAAPPVARAAPNAPRSAPVARPAAPASARMGDSPSAAPMPTPAAPQPAAPLPPGPAARVAATVQSAAPEALSRVGDLVRRMGTRIRREQASVNPERSEATPPKPAPSTTAAGSPATTGGAPAPVAPSAPAAAASGNTPTASFRPAAAASAGSAAITRAVPPTDAPAIPPKSVSPAANGGGNASGARAATPAPDAAPVAFASRRRVDPSRPTSPVLVSSGNGADNSRANPGGRIAVVAGKTDPAAPGLLTRLWRGGRRRARGLLSRIGLAKSPRDPGARKAARKIAAARSSVPEPIVPASRPPSSERDKASEAAALTIFGARNAPPAASGFARRGLMLTGGLILLLVAVGIWAVYFTASPPSVTEAPITEPEAQDVAALPEIAAPAPLGVPAPAPAPVTEEPATQAPDTSEPVIAAVPAEEPTGAFPDTLATADPDEMLEELVQQGLNEGLPAAIFDEPLSTPGEVVPDAQTESQQAPRLLSEDAPASETGSDRVEAQRLAMPQPLEVPQLAEIAPLSPPPPPPFGVEFNLGEDGLVEATPEGALTPAGVTVFARRPSSVPPTRPAGLAPEPAPAEVAPAPSQDESSATEAAPEVVFDDTPRADPALAGIRPPPRSERVAEIGAALRAAEPAPSEAQGTTEPEAPAATESEDGASLAPTPPPGGVSLAGLRPQRRPTDLVAPAVASLPEPAPLAEGTPEAVATSLRPTARPDDLSARIQQMLAASRPQQPAQAAAEPAPEPVAAAAAPQIPTSASVADQATQTRAISLRDVNLIGVFGTPSDRRALVRLGNGRVVRVQVGDQLDGGRVSAIGDDELRYVRNGRNEVLRIGRRG